MAIDKTYGGTPVYARYEDTIDPPGTMRHRKTQAYMKQDDTSILCIATMDGKNEYRWARLNVSQARHLMEVVIPEFLADQTRPKDELITRTANPIPDPRKRPTL